MEYDIIITLGFLALLVALWAVVRVMTRRHRPSHGLGGAGRVVGMHYLAPQCRVYVLDIQGHGVVCAVGKNGTVALHELATPQQKDAAQQKAAPKPAAQTLPSKGKSPASKPSRLSTTRKR